VKKGRTVEPNVDEGGLHAGQHARHATEVDIAHRRSMMTPLDVELAEYSLRNETNPRLSDVDVDQKCVVCH
jgi:hypothetical protein